VEPLVTGLEQLQSYIDAHPDQAADLIVALWAAQAAVDRLNELLAELGWEPESS